MPKPAKSFLHWRDDPPAFTRAIDAILAAGYSLSRPSKYQLKIEGINFYPGKGTVQIDGSKRQRSKGLGELFKLLEENGIPRRLDRMTVITEEDLA